MPEKSSASFRLLWRKGTPPPPLQLLSYLMRAKLHWKLAASALAALDTVAIRQGAYDRANKAMRNALTTEGWLAE